MQRQRNSKLKSKMSDKKSNDGNDQSALMSFFSLPDFSGAKRNLSQEIEEMEKFKGDLSKFNKEQLIEYIERMNEEHKKAVASIKSKLENDLAISQAFNKTTIEGYTSQILKLEKQIKVHQQEVIKCKSDHYQDN